MHIGPKKGRERLREGIEATLAFCLYDKKVFVENLVRTRTKSKFLQKQSFDQSFRCLID